MEQNRTRSNCDRKCLHACTLWDAPRTRWLPAKLDNDDGVLDYGVLYDSDIVLVVSKTREENNLIMISNSESGPGSPELASPSPMKKETRR